jgi:2-polyprenyl-3-methyl-5-hydroxy-6-metoxy-1,4-benzoquinol methylase
MCKCIARIEKLLISPNGMLWFDLLYRLQGGGLVKSTDARRLMKLTSLGICTHDKTNFKLTPFGSKCADSAREYVFWINRNRRLHGEDEWLVSRLENFRGKAILEIGAGWGCNLVRLGTVAERALGVEIEPVYVEFSKIIAKREGIPVPEIIVAQGEDIPLAPNQFDWIIIYSALEYMDIRRVFAECKRLLKPRGMVLTAQPVFSRICDPYLRDWRFKTLIRIGFTALNTIWYQCSGSRFRGKSGRPIHPTQKFLIRSAQAAGLTYRPDLSEYSGRDFGLVLENL